MQFNVNSNSKKNCEIAVIGIGCIYPGAKNPLEFWENILARRQQFREMPAQRLPAEDYYDPDPKVPDKTYQNKAAVIDGYKFDWLEKRIPKSSYESTDIVHWLALDTVYQALKNTGIEFDKIPKDSTGVIFGNSITGEFTRSNNMRLRWPYVKKVLRESLKKKGLTDLQDELEVIMEAYYKSVFAPVTEDTLAGGLANTIAGRVCNFFDFHGGGYIVDGACSSSLLAVTNAANALELGQMDIAIAGGVDISLDTFELIGFAKTGALTKDEMKVYDKNGNGFIPGEGCGVVVMKRLEDAIRDKNTIYAIIKGWGISSDGKGGITAPSAKGQSMALKRAYNKAGFDPVNLNFIEGHGTGTTVGDKIELEGISIALGENTESDKRICGVTSLKSIIGHTKAAAGVGAFIKTVIALNRRVLPPTAGIKEINPIFSDKAKYIYPITKGRVMDPKSTLYAGVSAMGFGGINSHVILQSGDEPQLNLQPVIDESSTMVSNQSHELFLFSGNNAEELNSKINEALTLTKGICYAELVDFAFANNIAIDLKAKYRAAVIAGNPWELKEKLHTLLSNISQNNIDRIITSEGDTILWGSKKDQLRIGGLFPGQGSQQINMAAKLIGRYTWAKEFLEHADQVFEQVGSPKISEYIYKASERALSDHDINKWKEELKQTNIAQPAITVASMIWFKYLKKLGLKIDATTGHSLGELSAFHASGLFSEDTLLKFAAYRGKMMSEQGSGAMASLICSPEKAFELINQVDGYAVVANLNTPLQTVISGEENTIDSIIELAVNKEIRAVKLPVSAAFHSKLVAETANAIKTFIPLNGKQPKNNHIALISSVTGLEIDDSVDLNDYFSEQAVNQVNFVMAINSLKKLCDIMVEIGPGKVLSGLANSIQEEIKCLSVEAIAEQDLSLQSALASLFVMGLELDIKELYSNRLIRDFIPASQKEFLVNPCERPFPEIDIESTTSTSIHTSGTVNLINKKDINFDEYWDLRADFIKELIRSDFKYLSSKEIKPPAEKSISNTIPLPAKPSTAAVQKPVSKDVRITTYEKIQHITGFPASNFKGDMKLLDDFNLDSIKAGSFLNDLFKTFGLQGKINASNFSNASLDSIIAEVEKLWAKTEGINTEVNSAITNIEEHIFNIVADKTGFPKEALKPEYRLLNDLNLDSIKAGSLLGELIKTYNLQGKIEPAAHANASIQEIISTIKRFSAEEVPSSQNHAQQKSVKEFLYSQVEEKTGFPVANLKEDFRLLDDLNLDSIKANALVTSIFKKYKLLGKIEVAKYSNATLSSIIKDIEVQLNHESNIPAIETKTADEISQVRSFKVCINDKSVLNQNLDPVKYWVGRKAGLISLHKSDALANTLLKSLHAKASIIQRMNYNELFSCDSDYNNLLVLLPDSSETARLEEVTELLSSVAMYQPGKKVDITFIQYGDGYFGKQSIKKTKNRSIYSAAAFASSIHLERPDCRITSLEFDPSLSKSFIEKTILHEIAADQPFNLVGYNKNKDRIILEYQNTIESAIEKRNPAFSENDVFVVTGGAKGITAECALAFAKKYRCKMALIGSSAYHGEEGEIKNILKRYSDEHIPAVYFSCNITDNKATADLVKQISKELGKVTGIIHGAGKNVPRRAENVTFDAAIDEISPKLKGAFNLYNALKDQELKYYIAFTSIIGITGMQGNSWYAFSNEMLDLYLRNINTNAGIETITLAYSVWSEVGMGERMGSTKTLAHMGIGSIPPERGVEEFMKWIENKADDQQIAITSTLGNLDTWKPKSNKLIDAGRFTEKIVYHEPGIELKARAILNEATDLYLQDHNYKGSLLFPTVFGIEAMSQAVATLAGIEKIRSVKLENVSLLKPIVVAKGGETEIEISVKRVEAENEESTEKKYQVGISTEQTNFLVDHFSALFILDQKYGPSVSVPSSGFLAALNISPVSDLYSWLLFQGPRFRLIENLYDISSDQTVFTTKQPGHDGSSDCFPIDKTKGFKLGNPLLRDTLLQSAQLPMIKTLVLPIGIQSWEIFDTTKQVTGGEVRCEVESRDADTGTCNVILIDSDNNILERITGYKVKVMQVTPGYPDSEELANIFAHLNTKFSDKLSTVKEFIETNFDAILYKHTSEFNLLNKEERRSIESEILNNYTFNSNLYNLKYDKNKLQWAENGKPSLADSNINISVSHSRSILLMILGESEMGCDIEKVETKELEDWQSLLEYKHSDLVNQMINTGIETDINNCYTRIWGVRETCMKAHAFIPTNISVERSNGDIIIFKTIYDKNTYFIISFHFNVVPNNKYIISFTAQPKEETPIQFNENAARNEDIFDPISRKFSTQFLTTFKDCRGFHGKTYFTDFPLWMGNLREYILAPVKKQLLKDLGSGEFGMVTNDSTINIYSEADTLDKITGRLWITEKSDLKNSLIDLAYEWYKHTEDGKMEKISDCVLSTTWVKIEKRGIVKISPIPQYFYDFLDSHLRKYSHGAENVVLKNRFPQLKDLGKIIYEHKNAPRPEILLNVENYHTGIYNSNTVGNLYYSNYYDWQAKNIESFFYQAYPDLFLKNGKIGEYICLKSNTIHLQEAMPFEEIEVHMYLEKLYSSGMGLYFEFYSKGKDEKRKLAYGHNYLLWAKRQNEFLLPVAELLPESISQRCLKGSDILSKLS